jgi:hypothetical protein
VLGDGGLGSEEARAHACLLQKVKERSYHCSTGSIGLIMALAIRMLDCCSVAFNLTICSIGL